MIQPERIKRLNAAPAARGRYVLYWMQSAQRARYNHALEYAIIKANELKKPVVTVFGLTDGYPEANLRHYYFMLEGLKETRKELQARGIAMVIKLSSPEQAVLEIAEQACVVVVDGGQLSIQRQWRNRAAKKLKCAFYEVETNLIVPVDKASDKENYSAGVLRPRITAKLDYYLVGMRHRKPKIDSLGLRFKSFDIEDIDKALGKLDIDRSVGKVEAFCGGISEAQRWLRDFIANKLCDYDKLRNDPSVDYVSNMSPYLHFGQISPLYIALEVNKAGGADCKAYLEELIVRRELSHNFVFYNKKYDSFDCLPNWTKASLEFHRSDKREYEYSPAEFEGGVTHDPYWNAAEKEMVITGKMHGYMRMYWGKKILEWSRTPRAGFKTALYLNNKYNLDGRDANSFAGVAWCFGKHDRPWADRAVFGKVRYMSAEGLRRKFDIEAYVDKIKRLERPVKSD